MTELDPADFVRGKPRDEGAQAANRETRAYVVRWAEEVKGEFPDGFELYDLMNGDVELVSLMDGSRFRLYTIPDYDEPRLIIDDYLPGAGSTIEFDDDGLPIPSQDLQDLEDELLAEQEANEVLEP